MNKRDTATTMDKTNEQRPGFKWTKLGWVPEEWEAGYIGDIVKNLQSGVSVNGEDRRVSKGEIGVLKVSSVSNGKFEPSEHKAIIADDIPRARINPRQGKIIISRANKYPGVSRFKRFC
ncbi:MAG: hypothetical protein KDD01_21795 [Phaeodactylibacter sp.]|nr:hypothetical protein [Phaeodactylibacter sp.]